MIGAPELNVGSHHDRVVGLEQGIEELGDGDGLVALVALGEVVAPEQLRHGELAGELDDVGEVEAVVPLGLTAYLGLALVDDLEELVEVALGVAGDLVGGEHGAGGRLTGGVADLGGPIADDEHDGVAELLELAELAKPDDVAEVDVRRAGVEALLEAQRLAGLEQPDDLLADDDVGDARA